MIICLALIASTYWFFHRNSAGNHSKKLEGSADPIIGVSAVTDTNLANINPDWKKTFFENSTSTLGSYIAKESSKQTSEEITSTDRFGRELLTQFIQLKQAGLSTNEDMVNGMLRNVIDQDLLIAASPRLYSDVDLKIAPTNDLVAYRDYGNRVGAIMKNNAPKRNDAFIAYEGIKSGDDSYLVELKGNVAKYQSILSLLQATPVPEDFIDGHLDLMNGVSLLSFMATGLLDQSGDPLKALAGLSGFKDAATVLSRGIIDVRDILESSGLSYSASEGGTYFMQ